MMTGKWTCIAALLLAATIASGCSSLPDKLNFVKKDKIKSSKDLKALDKPVEFLLSYAKLQEQSGNLAEAQESYRIVISKDPHNTDAQLGLARIAMFTGDLDKAEKLFQEVVKQAPANAEVLSSLGQFHAEKKDWARSAALFGQAAELEPENRDYRGLYAAALAHLGKTQEALTELRKIAPESEAHFVVAYVLKEEGNWRGAEYHVQQSLALNPKYPEARAFLEELKYAGGEHTRYAQHTRPSGMTPALPAGYERSANTSAAAQTGQFPGKFEYEEEKINPLDF